MTQTILHVVTNVDSYDGNQSHPTGLWLTELTHAWEIFERQGYRQLIVSPKGGKVPLEPRAMKFPLLDSYAKRWIANPENQQLLENTLSPQDIDNSQIDAIYYTGGHAVMYDFLEDVALQELTRTLYESDKVVASVCHGFCGLLNVKLSDGTYLIEGKEMTGFSWKEEVLAGVSKLVPYNAESLAQQHGAHYRKAALPYLPFALEDGNLVTGQNPFSAKKTAELISRKLNEK